MRKYAKSLLALVMTVLTAVVPLVGHGHLTRVEWMQLAISATAAFGVWAAANLPSWTWAKSAVAGVLAALNVLVTFVGAGGGSLTAVEWVNLGLAVLAAIGVHAVPNQAPAVASAPPAGS